MNTNQLTAKVGTMQLKMGSAVVSTAPVGVPPTGWQHSPWRTKRCVESAAPVVRRGAEQSDRDGRAPLWGVHVSGYARSYVHGLRCSRTSHLSAALSLTNCSPAGSQFSFRPRRIEMTPRWQRATERCPISASQIGGFRERMQSKKFPMGLSL